MSRMWTYIIFQPLSAVWNPVYPIHMPPLQILYGKICTKKGEKKMKCPFLESEDCETCGYYDYVPEKKCYNLSLIHISEPTRRS